jgi:hypothetical protein
MTPKPLSLGMARGGSVATENNCQNQNLQNYRIYRIELRSGKG